MPSKASSLKLPYEHSVEAAPKKWLLSCRAETVSFIGYKCNTDSEACMCCTYSVLQVEEVTKVQRSKNLSCEVFELDMSQITKLASITASDLQPSQGIHPARKKPSWMKSTHAPEVAAQPTHSSRSFDAYKRSSNEKGAKGDGGGGGGTPHLLSRLPPGFAPQSARKRGEQQQHAGGPLKTLNGTQHFHLAFPHPPHPELRYNAEIVAVIIICSYALCSTSIGDIA